MPFSRFITAQVTEAAIIGGLCFVGMLIFRFPYAPAVGALTGVMALIPIVVLRDASLDDGNVNLQFTFKDNGYFKPGYEAFSTHTLVISSHMAKPANWDTYYGDNNFGTYTELKHQLMIEWTGNSWDEDYLDELFAGDSNYVTYLSQWFIEKLEEENQKRQEAGLDIYREPNGEPVSFDPAPWY